MLIDDGHGIIFGSCSMVLIKSLYRVHAPEVYVEGRKHKPLCRVARWQWPFLRGRAIVEAIYRWVV